MANWKTNLYWHLPVRSQEAVLSLYSRKLDKIYFGFLFQEWKNWLIDSREWSRTKISEWKNERLKYIVEISGKHVPFYRKNWRGFDYKSVQSESDLNKLPLLEKQSVRMNEQSFIVDGINPKSLWVEKTSGTIGTSLKIYWPLSMVSKWWAINEVMSRYVAGVNQKLPRTMIGGRPIIPGKTNKPPFWRFNRHWKQLYASSYHISKQTALDYITAIKKYESVWLTGYGSSIAALAEFGLENGLDPTQLRSVIVSGDTLFQGMKNSIEKYFQCKCYDHYGMSEGVAMAMECPNGRNHVVPFAGVIEILREDGTSCSLGEVGEIVATGLLNDAMPLIRYRIGDYASWDENQECDCGNPNSIIKNLEGRVDDYLITKDGRKIGRLSTAMKRSPTIHSAQIVQDKPGHAYLLVRPTNGYRPSHGKAVCDDIIERIGKFNFDMIEVMEIPSTLKGKATLVVALDKSPEIRERYEKFLSKFKNYSI